MITIHTKFDGKRLKIKAYTRLGRSVTIPYPFPFDNKNDVERHFEAVKAYAAKYRLDPWDITDMRYGESSDGKGFTFCARYSRINTVMFMNIQTGSVNCYDGWNYVNELGEKVNAVVLGETVEVEKDNNGDWIEVYR